MIALNSGDSYLLENFFTYSEIVDLLVIAEKFKINFGNDQNNDDICMYLEKLESTEKHAKIGSYCLYLSLFERKDSQLRLKKDSLDYLYTIGGLKPILEYFVNTMQNGAKLIQNQNADTFTTLEMEIDLRVSFNLVFLIIYGNQDKPYLIQELKKLKTDKKGAQLENIMLKGIQLSLEISFVPIKKLSLLFHLYLQTLFGKVTKPEKCIKYLTKEHVDKMLEEKPRFFMKNSSEVEQFYNRNIMQTNENPFPQIIVFGLLRTLLTTCSQNPTTPPSGNNSTAAAQSQVLDLKREWESPYLYLQQLNQTTPLVNKELQEILQIYQKKENLPSDIGKSLNMIDKLQHESERHRFIIANAITSFFLFLLKNFRYNNFFQYLYLSQLISDSNGVLVLLKFVTEKFNTIQLDIPIIFQNEEKITFESTLIDTIYKFLKLMYILCNGYHDKIRSYLLDYNAFVSIFYSQLIYEPKCEVSINFETAHSTCFFTSDLKKL